MAGNDIYARRQWWKVILAVIGLLIVFITMFYSNFLAEKLAESERKNVELYLGAMKIIQSDEANEEGDNFTTELNILKAIGNIPIIVEDEGGNLVGNNFPEGKNEDPEFLLERKNAFINAGKDPIKGTGYASFIYYENSRLYKLITYFPIVQVLLLGAFVALGYFFFSTSRRAEQNRVWAGMAKETAHQLGTPISAILAWIDHLKDLSKDNPDQMEIIEELSSDVDRLELIADRFSKIGSAPKLTAINIYQELDECKIYMQRRASKRMVFDFPKLNDQKLSVNLNKHLFDWVIENLIRNSLDAMGAEGKVSANIKTDDQYVIIEISDTGKGIPANKQKTVFEPGYSTKTRGWGLGLSLAKRIIEDYHKGKIFVKNSRINEGTTFTIKLPKA